MTPPVEIFLAAGESSGDDLGARLMRALRRAEPGIRIGGVGGPMMEGEGLSSLFPMADLSVMGFSAVARRLPLLLRRIRQTAAEIVRRKPAAVVLIDAQDFSRRVAARVRRADPSIPIVGYVSPTVWAWRAGRARAMRPTFDEILAVLPFEPAALAALGGPPCTYVGHSLLEELDALLPGADERQTRLDDPARLVALPGSRRAEVRRLLPLFGKTLQRLAQAGRRFEVTIPTVPHVRPLVEAMSSDWPIRPEIVSGTEARRSAFRRARAALAACGTVTLELALADVPTVVAYRVSRVEAGIVRALVRQKRYALPNLILGEDAVQERMQGQATAGRLAAALLPLLDDGQVRRAQLAAFARLRAVMAPTGEAPSDAAASRVLALALRLPGPP